MITRRCLTLIRENSQVLENAPINYKDFQPIPLDEDFQIPQEHSEKNLTLIRQKSNKKVDKKEKEQQKYIERTKELNQSKNDKGLNKDKDKMNSSKEKDKFEDIFQKHLSTSTIELNRSKSMSIKRKTDNIFMEKEKSYSNLANKKVQSKHNKSKKLNIGHTETTTKFFDQKKSESKKEKPSKKIINVIKKVVEWRKKSYHEFGEKGKSQITKEDAALELGMKKKSLDDYLMVIRLGIVLGFSFKENLHKKFGELRKYVNQHKQPNDKWIKEINQDVEGLLASINQ